MMVAEGSGDAEQTAVLLPEDDGEVGFVAGRYELFLAFRYLKARRKQALTSLVSGVSILGIAVGVAALIIALALLTGFQEDIQSKIIGANAHVVMWGVGEAPILDYRRIVEEVRQVPGVVGASPVVLHTALLDNGMDQRFATVKGIDPAADTTNLLDRLVDGSAERLDPDADPPGIILGRDLATQLLMRVDDTLRIILIDPNVLTPLGTGRVRTPEARVVGIFEAGMFVYDQTWVLTDLETAQRLFRVGDTVSWIEVAVEDIYDTEPVMERIQAEVEGDFILTDWKRQNELFFSALALEKLAMFVVISLIVFVAALNIVATLVLLVMEKNRDIGILLSMGATRRGILYTFIVQGLFIGLMGTGIGLTLGIGLSTLADRYQWVSLPGEVYYLSHVPFIVRPFDFSIIALLAVSISFLATLYPAWRASRLDPVEALRYE